MTPNQSKLAALTGRKLTVMLESGQEEDVTVSEFRARFVPEVLEYCQDVRNIGRLVELACDKPKGWAFILTPASLLAAAEATKEMNANFFALSRLGLSLQLEMLPSAGTGASGSSKPVMSTPQPPA